MTNILQSSFLICVVGVLLSGPSGSIAAEELENGELIAVAAIFRHGERTPAFSFANDPNKNKRFGNLGPGQLTNVGKMQLYNLGKWLKQRYANFISDHYSDVEVKISSTGTHRCLTSAAALAAGLYPPKDFQIWNEDLNWQPIPIFTEDERILSQFIASPCKKFLQVRGEYFTKSENVKKIMEENKQLLDYLSEHTGQKFNSILNAMLIADTLFILRDLNLTTTEWMKNLDYDELYKILMSVIRSFGISEDIVRLTTGQFLGHILNHFFDHQAGKPKEKLLLFSAHDINLASIQVALGNKEVERPAYGSILIFELIRKNHNYHIQAVIKQKDDIQRVPITGCESECSVMDLKRALERILITEEEWYKECDDVHSRDEL